MILLSCSKTPFPNIVRAPPVRPLACFGLPLSLTIIVSDFGVGVGSKIEFEFLN